MRIILNLDEEFVRVYPGVVRQAIEYAMSRSDEESVMGVHLYGSPDRVGFLDAGVIVRYADASGNYVPGQSLAVNVIRRRPTNLQVEFVT